MHRFVCDLVRDELVRLRPGRAPAPVPWGSDVRFESDLGVDSLERLQLATALAEAIHLHASGVDDSLLVRPTVGEWVGVAAASLEAFSAELTFKTSGSTGQPKWCVHSLAELEAEVNWLAHVLPGCGRVIGAVPSHHIYGFLFTVLLPARLAVEVLDVREHTPARLGALLQPGDVVIGHPAFWRAFVRAVGHVAAGATGVTSTAPCPPETAHAAVAHGLSRFVEIYGSSETAGIGWRDDPLAAYELFPYWRRGTTDSELVRSLAAGGESAARVPDRLEWDGERHLRPAGRAEGAVQVGGVNVFPDRIGELLRGHPGVAQAAVRLMRPEEGDRLKAFIVPRGSSADADALRGELWAWIDTHLSAPERPKSIVFGAELPASALGKSSDWHIR